MANTLTEDIEAIGRIDVVPSILQIACRITGLRFAAVARVTDTSWTACAVRDEIAFGLEVGDTLDLKTTICDEIRESRTGVIIDHVAEDAHFRHHHTPRLYGFESYISIPILRSDGNFFGTLCALDPLPSKLSDPGILATFENFAQLISLQLDLQEDLRRTEDALAAASRTSEVRERFIAILGHDLRNPLAAFDAGTRILGRMVSDAKAVATLAQMQRSSQRMAALINDLLDFARGRLGEGLRLNTSLVGTLAGPLEQVIAELQMVHPDHPIDVQIQMREPVACDVERITQLLSNLLGNALAHGAAGELVRVSAHSGGGRFTLGVANVGPPIPEDMLPTLFQPFTRAAEAHASNGLGLGLFIASEIAKAHNGAIDVVSADNETRFTLTMPSA